MNSDANKAVEQFQEKVKAKARERYNDAEYALFLQGWNEAELSKALTSQSVTPNTQDRDKALEQNTLESIVGTLISWMAQSANSPISYNEAQTLLERLAALPNPPKEGA